MKLISLLLIVVAGAVYQICAKQTPSSINPFVSLSATYISALTVSLIFTAFTGGFASGAFSGEIKKLNWAPFVLGAVICLYELGFILAYRAGFKSSELSAFSSILLIIIMAAIGFFVYREHLSFTKLVGLALAAVGIFLATK